VPEISANKYVLNIRFIGMNSATPGAQLNPDTRARTADFDVAFELTFCNL
jgi:hypothetical protein